MFRLISTIIIYKEGCFFSPNYRPAVYLGDPQNICKILADYGVDEISVFSVGDNNLATIKKLPRFVNVPMSICGGINSNELAAELIKSGYDRVGINLSNKSNSKLLMSLISELGGSSCYAHIPFNTDNELEKYESIFNFLPTEISEVIFSDVARTGSQKGINFRINDIAENYNDFNVGASGGHNNLNMNHELLHLSSISYTALWAFQGFRTDLHEGVMTYIK